MHFPSLLSWFGDTLEPDDSKVAMKALVKWTSCGLQNLHPSSLEDVKHKLWSRMYVMTFSCSDMVIAKGNTALNEKVCMQMVSTTHYSQNITCMTLKLLCGKSPSYDISLPGEEIPASVPYFQTHNKCLKNMLTTQVVSSH